MEEIRVSDLDTSGQKGVYDSQSFCNSIIIDVDDALKQLFSGSRVAFCNTMIQIVRKMDLLRKGIADDLASKDRQIEDYKQVIRLMEEEKANGRADAAGKESDV